MRTEGDGDGRGQECEGKAKKGGGGEEEGAAVETHFIITLLPLQLHYLHSNNGGSSPAGPLLINNS